MAKSRRRYLAGVGGLYGAAKLLGDVLGIGGWSDDADTWAGWITAVWAYLSWDWIVWPVVIVAVGYGFMPERWRQWLIGLARKTPQKGQPTRGEGYLSDRDTELSEAIFLMASLSAWGRWFSSQWSDVQDREQFVMVVAAESVLNAAMNGDLEIRGRLPGAIDYESIPRTTWRLAALEARPHTTTLWKVVAIPRSGVDPDRISRVLSYDSLIVDSRQFEAIWPVSEVESKP